MARVVDGVGKTYDEAVQDGLSKIGLSKDEVTIELVKEPKKTFFSILEHRQVKVIVTEKTNAVNASEEIHKERELVPISNEELEEVKMKIQEFLNEFFDNLGVTLDVDMKYENNLLFVSINGDASGLIIGHRGETVQDGS